MNSVGKRSEELRAKISHISFLVKRLMHTSLSGDYRSSFKGSGLDFHQIRAYIPGDDVRSIDWKSSAKMNKVMIKQFVPEKERIVLLALDMRRSLDYSSREEFKRNYTETIAACLALIAQKSRDKVGLLLFTEHDQLFIPPRAGHTHVMLMLEKIFLFTGKQAGVKSDEEEKKSGGIGGALQFLAQYKKRNAILFLISDWIETGSYETILPLIGQYYDTIAVRVLDQCEREIPDVGLLSVFDPDKGEQIMIDTGSDSSAAQFIRERLVTQDKLFRQNRIDLLDISVGQPYVSVLSRFFHKRSR